MTQYLAYDIGGTSLKYALIDKAGHIIKKSSMATYKDNLDGFLRTLYAVADKFKGQFNGIAVCAPGKVDTQNKIIHYGGALTFLDGLNIQKTLGDKYQVPVGVENDGKAAALCEQWLGELHDVNTGAIMTLGTGVGGGILIDNRVLHGHHFQAGELSWMITNQHQGVKNMAAYTGHSCSAVNMIKAINLSLKNLNLTDGRAAFAAIKAGNPIAIKIFKHFCLNVAVLILNIQSVIDGSKIVIGGGVSSQPILITEIKNQFNRILDHNPMLKKQVKPPEIVAAKFRNDTNLYGALYALLLELNGQVVR